MKINKDLLKNFGFYTYAAFIICAVSGVLLALVYDVSAAYESLSEDFINNRSALIMRSLHYWSANIFMLFSFLHILDHILKNSFQNISKAVWFRLSLAIAVIFYLMLSGFLLRGDIESNQARMIFNSLTESVPFIGSLLSALLLGSDQNLQTIYVHHIATGTILVWLASIEHSKIFQPKFAHYWKVFILVGITALLFIPYLQNPADPVTKSPWYFLGLQEALHWFDYPSLILIISISFLGLIYFLKSVREKYAAHIKKLILLMFGLYMIAGVFAFFFRGEAWDFANPFGDKSAVKWGMRPFAEIFYDIDGRDTLINVPYVRGSVESCLVCHSDMKGFSPSHDPAALGCSSCHLGDNLALNKDLAHKGMTLIPGNLHIADETCGQAGCHSSISTDIHKSLMATMSGVISVDKWVFGEATTPDSLCDVMKLGHSEADTHLKNLCASCHLQGVKTEPAPIDELSRGGGCLACHIDYKGESFAQWTAYVKNGKKDIPKLHPQLNLKITNDKCFGCHSRSGRISTHYEGWLETKHEEGAIPDSGKYRQLQDGRVFSYVKPDIHHELGMLCTDCHSSYEIMGDGNVYAHKEQAVKIQCTDCHNEEYKNIVKGSELDYQSARIAEINNTYFPYRSYLKTEKSGLALINTFIDKSGTANLILKNTGDTLKMKIPSGQCGRDIPGHDRLSCESCHSSWTTSCVGCHNYYNKDQPGWDNLKDKETKGAWVEVPGTYEATPPALGIIKDENGKETISGFVPGMVLTINKEIPKSHRDFKRLYAPSFSHTIRKESRSCKSCHNDPFALGYGKGRIAYTYNNNQGSLDFFPYYPGMVQDMLPEDAWIDFLKKSKTSQATRTNARPFNINEQKRILRVGSCFSCHEVNYKKLLTLFRHEKNYMDKISSKCVLHTQLTIHK